MASVAQFYTSEHKGLSFELFPPKTDQGDAALMRHMEVLMQFSPDYITCTYGAGGSTQTKTMDVITAVKTAFDVPVASHLTCVGSTADDLRSYLEEASRKEVDFLVALRGDPPQGDSKFQAVEGGFSYANELVEFIRAEFPQFGMAVAGYPEVHQEALSAESDLENLKRKVDAGADIVITQLFYDNTDYFDFCDRCETAGIEVPIVPGILPVTNLAQIQRITSLCGSKLPDQFVQRLSQKEDDADWQFEVGVEFAAAQVKELIDQGAAGVHFYVLNKSQATLRVLEAVDW
ncbi:MAG TPA: methylenetetrahydrofolate reductase [NAD(P)H] [Planctomycetaceae bacterium]|nr:methylenetetrahydrofolate reductase [NAD(P)H] [Planctomycetaceae bacterium]|tara:strand:+ start:538 stop:1407 length:870 start_codon:yes stop_codon:yes gene_type:complete